VWTIEPREGAAHAAAAAAYLAAVLGFLLLQGVGLRLRREEHRAWWAGSGRDLLNVAGLLAIAGSLRLLGLSGPAALLVGGTLSLGLFGASVFVATQTRTAHPRAWALAAGLLLALPVLVAPAAVVGAFAALARALFSGAAGGASP
jgi:predicted ATP-grasp superfamily ATP-dependent carboligase